MVAAQGKSHKSVLTHPGLRVRRNQAHVAERTLYSITELSGSLPLGVNNADISTLECALLERMYYCDVKGEFVEPPPVTTGAYTTRLATFTQKLRRRLPHLTPISLDEVVEMYQGRKKTIYRNAMLRYELEGLTRKHGYLNCFVKLEKVNPKKAPRCIQPRNPVYNVKMATYIKPLEHRLYHAIDKVFGDGPTVIKGYNVDRIGSILRGKWRSFRKPVALGLDAIKFDMHVSAEALGWEHSIYNHIYRCKQLAEMLKWQIDNRGYGWCKDGMLRYRVKGRRASGDMNTALGNCLIMCGLVYEYALFKGVEIKLANNGDDCVIFMESEDLERFTEGLEEWFLEMGFRMAAEAPVYELSKIEFCQMHPIEFNDGTCRMIRNIPVALRKDTLCTMSLPNAKALRGWLTAVGKGGLALTGGTPVVQNLYRKFVELGEGTETKVGVEIARNSGLYLLAKGVNEHFAEPSCEVRAQVHAAWDITPDEQVALEKYIDDYRIAPFESVPPAVDSHANYNTILHALSR